MQIQDPKPSLGLQSSEIGSEAPKETTIKHEDIVKKMEGLKFRIEPDFVWVDSDKELTNVHEIINDNSFPIICRIRRLSRAPRSDRFDVEALPYSEQLLARGRLSHIRIMRRQKSPEDRRECLPSFLTKWKSNDCLPHAGS
ncbi:unnamed protein product [Gongylonema pulchrum]|uniref:Uncharacterized protein n=1 Tax=Gongylonema pulchrum TaxID=637853 RepID=A0A183ENA0_9BILA|nr:unnamed protein product [Gongylonema pulchrum]